MKVIQDIMRRYKVDSGIASAVREHMEENGLDFSECTQREFDNAMNEAFADLYGVAELLARRPDLATVTA